ncbi:MAG TPA: SGNH/GDSL hydrolase family protein [Ohtaekwangia sp.]|nr:SGNH/GDSL hydrolase family protein [Ohtaekwangia sp.]
MKRLTFILVLFALPAGILAQDPLRFTDEIGKMTASDTVVDRQNLIVFTGSSSIKGWWNLSDNFPGHNVINRGFGGSDMSDLLHYVQPLILHYTPNKVFIYEGDNDLNRGKSPQDVLKTAKQVLRKIRKGSPETEVIFISVKPSLARWKLKDQYQQYNQGLQRLAGKKNVAFVDVWTPMLNERGEPMEDIFVEDGLHMNAKGYAIWTAAIKPFVDH